MSTATSENLTPAPVATRHPHFSISFELDGFPVIGEVECKADHLGQIVARLKAMGATPQQKVTVAAAKSAGAPVCPVHGSPMKASRKPGSYFCPKRTDDGGYCPEKA